MNNLRLINLVLPVALFVCLTFIHFVSDWVFQSHDEAMVKHNNARVRAKHCAIYTLLFWPFFLYLDLSWAKIAACSAVLFLSHFIEDTYIPVYFWAKLIRRPPEFSEYNIKKYAKDTINPNAKAFEEFSKIPLGKILAIVIDQLVHLVFLWVVAFIILT